MLLRRMCSRLRTGSAFTPSRPSRPVTVLWTRSRKASASSTSACGGASNERSTDTGMPAELPGV
jgi:hypothetical protein